MDTIIPFEVNKDKAKANVLIASQGSRFKDSLVQGILKHYQQDSIYFKVIDVYMLFTVPIDEWDAIIMINSWEYYDPPSNLTKYIRKYPDRLDKLIILSTVGSSNRSLEDIDVISGESIIEKVPDYMSIIVTQLNKIIE
ncbi:hypothetical protein [Aquimarina pacifica]|uniref:hypothetical protein n=1 Tax=Aquimarina pacifica TaxID=1296415 RepID=UPI00054E3E74|nr:hypothetical protein [Aquimarina pacifica]